jgi:CRP-like cAMP-binding protein
VSDDRARFVDPTERIIYLRSIPVAAVMPTPVLRIIAAELKERTFSAGEKLMQEGEPIHGLHLLIDGKLSLERKGAPFGTLAPPQSLGFLGILARSEGTYDARAETPVRTLEFDADTLLEVLEDHHEFLEASVRYLAERLLYEIQELPQEAMERRLEGAPPSVPERELDLVERILMLRRLRAFGSTNLNALAVMARHLVEQRLEPNTPIWRKGDASSDAFIVLSGTLVCEERDSQRKWRAGPTSVLGGLEAFAEKPRWYDLSAESNVVGFHLPEGSFQDLLEDDFGLASDFIATLAADLLGILEKKAASGQSTVNALRNVTKLGAVPVGA